MLIEEWKEYPKNTNYLVSNLGKVYSLKTNKILKHDFSKTHRSAYPRVTLFSNGKRDRKLLHRIVAETFIPNDNKEFNQVNHIDGNKLNNCSSNLEWCSQELNMQHAVDNKLHKSKKSRIKATNNQTGEEVIFESWKSFFNSPTIKMGYIKAKNGGDSKTTIEVIDYVG